MFSDLIDKGLVKESHQNGLYVYKYAKKVFYNNLWHLDDRLLEARGIILDEKGNIVHRPFKKVFNLNENGVTVDRDKEVLAVRKVNGFMGAITYHNGQLLYGTTGSLTSDFAKMVEEEFSKVNFHIRPGCTYLFEVVVPSDPHIVEEEMGMYLIGIRNIKNGSLASEGLLDHLAEGTGVLRPETTQGQFSDILEASKDVKHEGFMIIDPDTNRHLCKIKSKHYSSKKFLMRMGKDRIKGMFNKPDFVKKKCDEEFYPIIDKIVANYNLDSWLGLTDQERRIEIEKYVSY